MFAKTKDVLLAIIALFAFSTFIVLYARLAAWWLEKTILFLYNLIRKTNLFKK